jgi:hypothetical protein
MKRLHRGIGLLGLLVASLGTFESQVSAEVLPRKIFAVSQTQPGGVAEVPGAPSDSILFYDVTDIGHGVSSGVFNNSPLFSVWMGFEIFIGEQNDAPEGKPIGNREDFSAVTYNPANGTMYAIAFDSDSPLATDLVGDRMGDFDLYKIDYQAILNDFTTNARPQGTIYAPEFLRIDQADEEFLQTISSPLFDGTVDEKAFGVPHPSLANTVHLPGSFEKIGEVGRSQSPASFFDYQLGFVNPETLVMLDANTGTATPATQDYNIRVLDRVSTSPGAATPPPPALPPNPNQEGGFNGAATQSWNSKIAGRLELDPMAISSPAGWTLVNHDGVLGVWAADSDGGGDDIAFYELNLSGATPTATKRDLFTSPSGGAYPTQFGLAEDPTVDTSTNDGESDYLFVDKAGNLVIVESGFFDPNPDPNAQTGADMSDPPDMIGDPAFEPRVITVEIADYQSPDSNSNGVTEVVPAGGGFNDTAPYSVTSIPISGDLDNDTEVTNTTRVAYDKSTGYLYIIDQDIFDVGQDTFFHEDIYVFDPASGEIVYHEFKPFDIGIFNEGTQIVFTRGDIDGSGMVDYNDILTLKDAIADPTLGGTVTAALGGEWYDLTGDLALTAADLIELVEEILGTALGDFDLDGDVDGRDFLAWQRGGEFGASDLADWQLNYGFSNMALAASVAIPEPAALSMCGLALVIGTMSVRRRL